MGIDLWILIVFLQFFVSASEVNYSKLKFDFHKEPTDQIVGSNSLIFDCSFEYSGFENLTSKVQWKSGELILNGDSDAFRILGNNSLEIKDASALEEPSVRCLVILSENSQSWIFVSKRGRLFRSDSLGFSIQPSNQKAVLRQSVVFRCVPDLGPNLIKKENFLDVEWFHNNHRVIDGIEDINVLPITNSLEITNVEKKHSGTYKCIIRSPNSVISSQIATLDVVDGSSLLNFPIEFALEPRSQSVLPGSDILLECLANGIPKPKISWIREKLSPTAERIGVDRSSLLIRNISAEDGGKYICRAENGEETLDSVSSLTVLTPPIIRKAPANLVAQETADVEFECEAEGRPPPRILWLKNGEIIRPSEYFVISENRLKIYGLIRDDQSVYQCLAESEGGSVQSAAILQVDAAAISDALLSEESLNVGEPKDLRAQTIGSRSLRLKWNPPFGLLGSSQYSIFYGEKEATELQINSSTPSVTIPNLNPNTQYFVRVAAIQPNGYGKWSEIVEFRTLPLGWSLFVGNILSEKTLKKVENLKVTVLGSDSADVSWSPTASAESSIRYRLFYKNLQTKEEIQAVTMKPFYTLHNLGKNVEYSVRAESTDGEQTSPSSESVQFRTFSDIPSAAPTEISVDSEEKNSLRIRWSPPPLSDQNGDLTGYRLRYKAKIRGAKSLMENIGAESREFTLKNLQAAPYQIRIAAQNSNGTGPFSEWLSATVEGKEEEEEEGGDEVAPAPAELRVFAAHNSIHVSWSPPPGGVSIKGYIVGWGVYVPDREKTTVGADEREYTISNLRSDKDYVISVRAITRAGDGFPIYETVKVSSTSVRLSFSDPNENPHQIYTIKYSPIGEENFSLLNKTETEVIIDGLQPHTQYEFAVRLANSAQWSMSALSRTLPSAPSSAPRDLSVIPSTAVSTTVTLKWQPPKYPNGDLEEYVILYSESPNLPDRDWIIDGAKGDQLSLQISDLSPNSVYYFKIQARNSKGYGPLSSVVSYSPDRFAFRTPNYSTSDWFAVFAETARENFLWVLLAAAVVIFLLVILSVALCFRSRRESVQKLNARQREGYVSGSPSARGPQPDCWITHPSNRIDLLAAADDPAHELRQIPAGNVDSPNHRVRMLQGNPSNRIQTVSFAMDRQNKRKSLPPELAMSQSVSAETRSRLNRGILRSSGRNSEDIMSTSMNSADSAVYRGSSDTDSVRRSCLITALRSGDGNGTLSRHYHLSTTSLENRQRTPQIIYTGSNRQPISKVDIYSDRGSSFGGSNSGLPVASTPPLESAYQTVRQSNALRSFTRIAPPPPAPTQSPLHSLPEQRLASVRPVVVASPNNIWPTNRTTGADVPIGRAFAQPRVNVASIYSPYESTVGSKEDLREEEIENEKSKLLDRSASMLSVDDDVNPIQLDTMIGALQQLRQGFDN